MDNFIIIDLFFPYIIGFYFGIKLIKYLQEKKVAKEDRVTTDKIAYELKITDRNIEDPENNRNKILQTTFNESKETPNGSDTSEPVNTPEQIGNIESDK